MSVFCRVFVVRGVGGYLINGDAGRRSETPGKTGTANYIAHRQTACVIV
jgi:hypothetical protein